MLMLNDTELFNACIEAVCPDPEVNLVEWANEHMVLTRESSIEPGPYRSGRTPYVEEILLALSPQSSATEVIVIKPTQMGFTTLANIFLFAIADRYPGPCLFVQPTNDMAQNHSKDKIAPSLEQIETLRGKVREAKSRDSGNTILKKNFPGGSWTLTGSNSPVAARSRSIRYLVLDDYDGFVANIGQEGDPGSLFKKRTDAYGGRKKVYMNSTPTLKGLSHIEREFEQSSQGQFEVPCPFCGHYQFLWFGEKEADYGLKFSYNKAHEITDIYYECANCHQRVDEYHKTAMMAEGRYNHLYPDRKKRGFKVNSLYSPAGWLSWSDVASEFLDAKDNPEKLQVWTNTRLAETWEEKGSHPDWEYLKSRAEQYEAMTVPSNGVLLTAGVDVQENRIAVEVVAWGRGEESWTVYWEEIYGNPENLQDSVWQKLDHMLNYQWKHENGGTLLINSCAIDSGGRTTTQTVYNFCRVRQPRVFAVKGASQPAKPVIGKPSTPDVTYMGQTIKNGVQLWPVGTDTAKSIIYARLDMENPGPGYMHFPAGLSDDYYMQLTGEKMVHRIDKKGYPVKEWVMIRRNEALDCRVYAYAAAIRDGINSPRIDWSAMEQKTEQEAKPRLVKNEQKESQPKPKKKSHKGGRW